MSNGNHPPSPPPPDYTPPTERYPPPPLPNKSLFVPITIIVVVVIIIAAIGGAFLQFGSNAQNSPESTFKAFFDAVSSGNTEKALGLTDAHFLSASDFDDAVDEFDDSDNDGYEYKLISTDVAYKDDMSSDERDEFEANIEEMENELDIKVDDYAIVNYEIEATYDGETDTNNGEMPCVKVDGKWYLVIFFVIPHDYSSTTPFGSMMSMEALSETEAKLTFGSFTGEMVPTDIRIILTADIGTVLQFSISHPLTGSETLMTVTGGIGVTATYTDLNYQGNAVNAGDFFMVTGLTPGMSYSLSILYLPTDSFCQLTGPTVFQTPSSQTSTSKSIVIRLSESDAPITCTNFKKYVNDGFYNGLIFHRVIDGFMIQGGAYYPDLTQKTATYSPVSLEINSNLNHIDGAISMARTSDPNSATSQFFICDGAQSSLDGSYAVFGQVTSGMEHVRAISALPTSSQNSMSDVPVNDVVILNASSSTAGGITYVTFVVDY